jgi:hypothetical protein
MRGAGRVLSAWVDWADKARVAVGAGMGHVCGGQGFWQ